MTVGKNTLFFKIVSEECLFKSKNDSLNAHKVS